MRVEKVWEETRILYEEELEISLLQKELEQAERWLSSYENTLMAEEYGVGPDCVVRTLWSRLCGPDCVVRTVWSRLCGSDMY